MGKRMLPEPKIMTLSDFAETVTDEPLTRYQREMVGHSQYPDFPDLQDCNDEWETPPEPAFRELFESLKGVPLGELGHIPSIKLPRPCGKHRSFLHSPFAYFDTEARYPEDFGTVVRRNTGPRGEYIARGQVFFSARQCGKAHLTERVWKHNHELFLFRMDYYAEVHQRDGNLDFFLCPLTKTLRNLYK